MMKERSGVMTDGQSEDSRYRLKFLRIPTPRFHLLSLVGLAVIVLLCVVMGAMSVALATTMIPTRFEVLRVVVVVTGGALGLAAAIWFWAAGRHDRLMRESAGRNKRLLRIVSVPSSSERFPHRLIEASLRSFNPFKKKVRTTTQGIPPRNLIIVVSLSDVGLILPTPSEVDLEPIEICPESEAIFKNNGALLVGAIRSGELKIATEVEVEEAKESEVEWHPTIRRRLAPLVPWFGYAFCFWVVLDEVMNGGFRMKLLYFVGAVIPLSAFTYRLFFERRWWLVPGGLAYREVAAWRRGMRVGLITPEDSSLVLDWRSGDGYLHDGSRGFHFKCGEYAGWAIACMWMSTARRRTLSEMRSFFGADEG